MSYTLDSTRIITENQSQFSAFSAVVVPGQPRPFSIPGPGRLAVVDHVARLAEHVGHLAVQHLEALQLVDVRRRGPRGRSSRAVSLYDLVISRGESAPGDAGQAGATKARRRLRGHGHGQAAMCYVL